MDGYQIWAAAEAAMKAADGRGVSLRGSRVRQRASEHHSAALLSRASQVIMYGLAA